MFKPNNYCTVMEMWNDIELFDIKYFDNQFISLWGKEVALYCYFKNRTWIDIDLQEVKSILSM